MSYDDGDHLVIHTKNAGTYGTNGPHDPASTVVEVSFDEADVAGTFPIPGHPGVVGLGLNAYTVGDEIVGDLRDITVLDYVVPDLRPADRGYMFRRLVVWPPGRSAYTV